MRRVGALACIFAAFAGLAGAAPAGALTLDQVRVVIVTDGTDAFSLKGRRAPLDLAGADGLDVAFDRFAIRIPIDRLRRRKHLVTFRDTSAGARVTRLRLDLRSGRFVVAGADWSLLDLPNPLRVSIGTATDTDCALARLRDPAARRATRGAKPRRATRLLLAGRGGDGPCDALESLQSAPIVVTAGVPTAVEFSLRAAATVDPASLRIRRLDAAGRLVGDPLCTPVADGAGRVACTATLTEATAGSVTLVTEGLADGKRVSSIGYWLPIVAPRTDADLALVAAAAEAVPAAWDEIRASQGDTLDARLALVRRLRTVPGILRAGLSPDGVDVTYRFITGWQGGLVLNRVHMPASATPIVTAVERPPARVPASSRVAPPQPRAIFRTCPDGTPEAAICCQPRDRRAPLLGRTVLIWNPGFFRAEFDDAIPIKQQFEALPCLGHEIEEITGANADLASIARFTSAHTLVISTHGMVLDDDQVMIVTGQPIEFPVTPEQDFELRYGLLGAGRATLQNSSSARLYFAVTEKYLRQLGRFPERAIVYASYCFSGYHGAPFPFLDRGAGSVLAYSWSVSENFTAQVAGQVFAGLVPDFLTAGEAYDRVTPKQDPTPRVGQVPDPSTNRWLSVQRAAEFTLVGDRRIAYVGQPEITPPAATVAPGASAALTAMAEGTGTCEMNYHWHSDGEAGALSNADGSGDFVSLDPTADYTADTDPEATADDVGVELLGPALRGAVGTSCADAMVVTTTTTSSTTTTTLPTCGAGVVEAADVFEQIDVDVGANDLQGGDDPRDGFHPADVNGTFGPGTTDTKPWTLSVSAGGAQASSTGQISYTIAPCSITAQGTFHESSVGGSAVGNAVTGLEARLQIGFRVSRQTPYRLTGSVTASGTPKSGDSTVFYARCSGNFDTTEASLQAPSGVPVPFARDSTAFPGETLTILCSVRRGGSSTDAFGDDDGTLSWNFTVSFD